MKKLLLIIMSICLTAFAPNFVPTSFAKAETSTCKAKYLLNVDSGKVVEEFNEEKRLPIASMCKIMTLNLLFDEIENGNLNMEQDVVVSENASGMGGSQAFLEENQIYKLKDLTKSIIISSANDSSVVVAELICGSEEEFVNKMNEKAESLGMENTLFANCTGLPKPAQYSCAKDVAIMTKELISHPLYFDYSTIYMDEMIHTKGTPTELVNTNKLVKFYKGCDGGKTGYTSEARFCLSATAMRNDMRMIAVVIGAESGKQRFNEVSTMFNNAFSNYKIEKLVDKENFEMSLPVAFGKQDKMELGIEQSYCDFLKKNEKSKLTVVYELPQKLVAPLKQNEVVGKAVVFCDKQIVDEINIFAKESCKEQNYGDVVGEILKKW